MRFPAAHHILRPCYFAGCDFVGCGDEGTASVAVKITRRRAFAAIDAVRVAHRHPTFTGIPRPSFQRCDAIRRGVCFPKGEIVMTQLHRITVNSAQCAGRTCVRGMRIRVKDVLDMLASGASTADILRDYPYLESEDITAVLEYAAQQADHPVLRVA